MNEFELNELIGKKVKNRKTGTIATVFDVWTKDDETLLVPLSNGAILKPEDFDHAGGKNKSAKWEALQ